MKEYPDHCIGCWNESKCRQKFYMSANTEPVPCFVGEADVWCEDHAEFGEEDESLGYYPETDSPLHCSECGIPLQCSLTDYGVDYVKEHIKTGGGCCRELWPGLFTEYLN